MVVGGARLVRTVKPSKLLETLRDASRLGKCSRQLTLTVRVDDSLDLLQSAYMLSRRYALGLLRTRAKGCRSILWTKSTKSLLRTRRKAVGPYYGQSTKSLLRTRQRALGPYYGQRAPVLTKDKAKGCRSILWTKSTSQIHFSSSASEQISNCARRRRMWVTVLMPAQHLHS